MDAARCRLAVMMASSGQAFREFEQAGWESASVVAKYHEHISGVTTQSVEALLDAADIRSGSRILDVATGAGYIAGAAAQRGAHCHRDRLFRSTGPNGALQVSQRAVR